MSEVTYRAPTLDDAPAVFSMLAARDVADYGVVDITLEDLRDEWQAELLDLEADAIVAQTRAGEIVGYAIINRPGAMGFVSPAHEGRGIGAALVAWAQGRERAQGRSRHRQAAAAGNVRARDLFLGCGYAYERSYARMVRALEGSEAEPHLAGFTVRALAPVADAPALHALDMLSFADNADYRPEPLEAFVDEHLRAHDLAPELSLVACAGEAMAGFLLARRWRAERAGFVDLLAVHPERRRRGLGSALLGIAFARFAADGLREAQLGVASDNPRALALYERLGMSPRFVVDAFARDRDP